MYIIINQLKKKQTMKLSKLISIAKSLSIAIIILGIIHDIATFTPLIRGGLTSLDAENMNAITYISLICGTALILSGTILFKLLGKLSEYSFLFSTLNIIGIFLALNGILAVIYMFNNPFAWIALVLNLSMFAVIQLLKPKVNSISISK